MNIHDKIEKIFSQERSDAPDWALELLGELKLIRTMLETQEKKEYKPQKNIPFFRFIDELRENLKPDIANNIYPEVTYQDKKIGVNFKGLLYYKKNGVLLSRNEAYLVYKYLYDNKLKAV